MYHYGKYALQWHCVVVVKIKQKYTPVYFVHDGSKVLKKVTTTCIYAYKLFSSTNGITNNNDKIIGFGLAVMHYLNRINGIDFELALMEIYLEVVRQAKYVRY